MKSYSLLFIIIFAVVSCSSGNENTIDTSTINLNASSAPVLVDINPAGQETLPQSTTQVEFDIIVPAYQSDALQVTLVWGVNDITVGWVGDEFWSVSAEFPVHTEHLLKITFSDNYGDLILGTYEQAYRTGSNTLESFQITADQFETDKWDSDDDGVSNLEESISQTDPLVSSNTVLEVRDNTYVHWIVFLADTFEHRITTRRPYNFNHEEYPPIYDVGPPRGATHIVTIDIDNMGNGDLSDFHQSGNAWGWNEVTQKQTQVIKTNAMMVLT